jgi:hypothetical protein
MRWYVNSRQTSHLNDNGDDFNLSIVNFPCLHICSDIRLRSVFIVYVSAVQSLIRFFFYKSRNVFGKQIDINGVPTDLRLVWFWPRTTVYLITIEGSQRVWPVNRECLLPTSHLIHSQYIKGSQRVWPVNRGCLLPTRHLVHFQYTKGSQRVWPVNRGCLLQDRGLTAGVTGQQGMFTAR